MSTALTALRKAENRFQRDYARAEKSRQERNRLILEELQKGVTHARIAEVTGLSRGRISQIKPEPEPEPQPEEATG